MVFFTKPGYHWHLAFAIDFLNWYWGVRIALLSVYSCFGSVSLPTICTLWSVVPLMRSDILTVINFVIFSLRGTQHKGSCPSGLPINYICIVIMYQY